MPPFARLHRHFLPWDRPWLPQATAWLARHWDGSGPIDLSSILAIVPTRQSARRLREALAEHAAARGTAVFPPRLHTPDMLLTLGSDELRVATRLESLLAWTEVLRRIDLATVAEVFPVPPPRRDFAWAWRLAESFYRLQTQLTEGGLALADVAERGGEGFAEAERWRQLARLEELQEETLRAAGLRESHAARRDFARAPHLPPGVDRVILLAVPDPLPLALDVVAAWSHRVPTEVVIFAPPGEAAAFDAVGRPLPAAWERRGIDLPDFGRRVEGCPDPAGEAERVSEIVRRYERPDGLVALGLADPEVLPLVENALARAGVSHYNPEGRPRRSERLHALLAALAALAREPSYEAVAALARCPDFLACLAARWGDGFSRARFLQELDDVRLDHLPADLPAVRAMANPKSKDLARGLAVIEELRAGLARAEFPAGAVAALGQIFGGRRFDLERPEEARAADAAAAWRDVMRECAAIRERFPALRPADWWDVALRLFGDGRRSEEKPADAIDLQGWLELLWEDAPHLVVAGMNEGFVPDAIVGDAFLPESLREKLGLKTNAMRFARDAYLLQAMAAARADGGRLDLLFAKTSGIGEPLRPSRLLLRCADAELPERVAYLFRPAEAMQPNLPWTRAWKLSPRREPPPPSVPVTGLRTWLACPFRFYLRHVLRMEAVDPLKSEMDALDFGTLCHSALEAMAREAALRDCTDEGPLRDFLLAELERGARQRFGDSLTLPLVVQLESARQRLAKVARLQAQQRAAGWVIDQVEASFTLDVGGLQVRGKVDRIDRHETSGAWRVLDYKTSDVAVPPPRSHLRAFRPADARRPSWIRVRLGGREAVWADLQLPVYLRALAGALPSGAAVECGYINLPKAAGETALALWPELRGGLLEAAQACIDGVAAQIRAGEFWPPAEVDPAWDAFAALFHHGVEDSIAWAPEAPALAAMGEARATSDIRT